MIEVYKRSRFKSPKFLGTIAVIEGLVIIFLLFYAISVSKNNGNPLDPSKNHATEQPQPTVTMPSQTEAVPVQTEIVITNTPAKPRATQRPTPKPTPTPTPEPTPVPTPASEPTPEAV